MHNHHTMQPDNTLRVGASALDKEAGATERLRFGLPLLVGAFLLLQSLLSVVGTPGRRANVEWWTAVSSLTSSKGLANVWTPYPPVFPLIHFGMFELLVKDEAALARALAREPLTPEDAQATIDTVVRLENGWTALNAVLVLGQAWLLVVLLERRRGRGRSFLAAFGFVLFNLSWRSWIHIGIWSDQFDALSNLLILGALACLERGADLRSAALVGVGLMTKLYPGVLVPLAVARMGSMRRATRYLLVTGSVVATICLPYLISNRQMFFST